MQRYENERHILFCMSYYPPEHFTVEREGSAEINCMISDFFYLIGMKVFSTFVTIKYALLRNLNSFCIGTFFCIFDYLSVVLKQLLGIPHEHHRTTFLSYWRQHPLAQRK